MPTIEEIEEDVTQLSGRDPDLALRLLRITLELKSTRDVPELEKPAMARLLCEIVDGLLKQSDWRRRQPAAMAHLAYGFRRMVAGVPDLARLWAGIEPLITKPV